MGHIIWEVLRFAAFGILVVNAVPIAGLLATALRELYNGERLTPATRTL